MATTKASSRAFAVIILLSLFYSPHSYSDLAHSQGTDNGVNMEAGVAIVLPDSWNFIEWSEKNLRPTSDQLSQLEYWSGRNHLSGPARSLGSFDSTKGSESLTDEKTTSIGFSDESIQTPAMPSGSWLTRKTLFGSIIPPGFSSNVMESSVSQSGQFLFFTGNWFAARSTDGGVSWKYASPFSNMPDFCCDQVSISDESRNAIFWLRMGVPDQLGENRFRLGVSTDGGASFCNFNISPEDTNTAWIGQWWDYPHIQLGENYMYVAWNMFNNFSQWTRTVMLRLPLDSLITCSELNYNYVSTSSWFTFLPVQGADKTMYFASNWALQLPNNRLGIWRWDESAQNPTFFSRSITAWSYTNRDDAICGTTNGNWAARSDDRLLSGSIYQYKSLYPSRPVIGFWWNVKQGGAFPHPYIEGAAFFADTLTQVPGSQGRPLIYSKSTCLLYPTAASNPDGLLALVFHFGYGPNLRPAVAFTVADTPLGSPPGFFYFPVQVSNARPADNKWGDYNTIRWIPSYPNTWTAGSHYITQSQDCVNCSAPVFFTFMRGKIYQNNIPLILR